MPTRSAGLLLYRRHGDALEVLIAHMGGPLWAKKNAGAWTIPKGEYLADEDPLAAALREFREETGHDPPDGSTLDLGEIRQASGKRVRVFAREGDLDPETLASNTFTMEWPPRSGRKAEFPEIDRLAWVTPSAAEPLLVSGQAAVLDALRRLLAEVGTAQ